MRHARTPKFQLSGLSVDSYTVMTPSCKPCSEERCGDHDVMKISGRKLLAKRLI